MVNALDANLTGFPIMSLEEHVEFCGGSHLADLSRSYVSSYRVNELKSAQQPYQNLQNYHDERRQLSQHIGGWIFDQIQPPRNWNGIWPGMSVANTMPWQPVRILAIPKIPSRYSNQKSHTTVIAFVPDDWPLTYAAPGFKCQVTQRISMFICGQRSVGKCKSGARTAGCCAHVATAAYICGVLAHTPGVFKSTWREVNYIDAGANQTEAHTADLLSGLLA